MGSNPGEYWIWRNLKTQIQGLERSKHYLENSQKMTDPIISNDVIVASINTIDINSLNTTAFRNKIICIKGKDFCIRV